jgi:ectoine hydroxylase-related dioxygenase (phytanoyl-CoA dioxygenase family)
MPDSLGSLRPQHRPALAPSLVDEYRERGFVTVPAILDTALMAALKQATDQLWEAGRSLTEKTRHYDLSAGHCADSPRIRRVSSPTELDPIFEQAAFDSVLGDIAADLIGGPVKFYHSKINFKLPGGGEEIGWHQDWPVFPHTNANLVALSVPLTPSRKANGCLRTIPGSHRGGARSHWADGRYVLNCNQSMSDRELATAEDSEVDPGDVVAHHGLVVHGSAPNPSLDIRTTWIIQYAAADAFAYTAPVIDSRHRNRMVRGEPASHARVEAGVIELPPDFSAGYSSIYSLQTETKA